MGIIFRKAEESDIDSIAKIYEHIHDAEERGDLCIGWQRGVYPTVRTARDALLRDDMYVCEYNGRVLAAAIINKIQVDVYEYAEWMYEAKDEDVSVMHTLVVEPSLRGGGIGSAFVDFYEKFAREQNCKVLRIDTNERNAVARRLYAKLGFREVGIVPTVFNGISGVNLVLLEKSLVESRD